MDAWDVLLLTLIFTKTGLSRDPKNLLLFTLCTVPHWSTNVNLMSYRVEHRSSNEQILSTWIWFFIFNQSDCDPGRDRSGYQWYSSQTPYRKATATVGVGGELGTFILYIFIPRSVTSKTQNVCVMGQQAFFCPCTHERAAHAVLTDFWLYNDNWGTTRMGFDPIIAGTADTGLTVVPQTLL